MTVKNKTYKVAATIIMSIMLTTTSIAKSVPVTTGCSYEDDVKSFMACIQKCQASAKNYEEYMQCTMG